MPGSPSQVWRRSGEPVPVRERGFESLPRRLTTTDKDFFFFFIVIVFLSLIYLVIYVFHFNKYKYYELDEIGINLIGERIETCGYVEEFKEYYNKNVVLIRNFNSSLYFIDYSKKYKGSNKKDGYLCVRGIVKVHKSGIVLVNDR